MLSHSPYGGLDLDRSVKEGNMLPWAKDIVEEMDTYGEYSPSWNKDTGEGGVHVLFVGKPPKNINVGTIEIYGEHHYLTITTNHLPGTPTTINPRQEAVDALFARIANDRFPTLGNTGGGGNTLWTPLPAEQELRQTRQEPTLPERPDKQIIQAALQEERSNFSRYWNGDPTLLIPQAAGVKPERNSPSEIFFVLLLMLLSRTGDNKEQVKRLYWQSPFAATYPKAARIIGHDKETGAPVTYLESSIRRAIEKRGNPPQRR